MPRRVAAGSRSVLAGMKKLVARIGPAMTYLAVRGYTHFNMAAKAPLMKGPLEARFILVIEIDILFDLLQVFSAKTLDRVAITTCGRIRVTAV